MTNCRIISNGETFKIQTRFLMFFWRTVQRPEDLDNKDFGGDASFDSIEKAKTYIARKLDKPKYKQVFP